MREPDQSFGALWARIHGGVAGLTAIVLLVRNLPPFLKQGQLEGYRPLLPGFLVEYTITLVVLVLFNAVTVSLPLAAVVHYVRSARPRD